METASDGASSIESLTAALSAVIAGCSLIVSLVAYRLTKEQARAYLFPAPAIYVDPIEQCISMRNFGPGAMLNVAAHAEVHFVGREPVRFDRLFPGLTAFESTPLIGPEILSAAAVSEVRADVRYSNIRGRKARLIVSLSSRQLLPLDRS